MRGLRAKGRTIEQLSVGFGTSYNTTRAALKEGAPASSIGQGHDGTASPSDPIMVASQSVTA